MKRGRKKKKLSDKKFALTICLSPHLKPKISILKKIGEKSHFFEKLIEYIPLESFQRFHENQEDFKWF